ncbi:SusC/RagA family TonB-linked outer membrane protein [Foetidibacter luteolus]|uniref:SusC/RagA family TonB-linked outer membrane protein n=1 Tax=Foetidibacter luteolus TaxID=2608880 RepID=UPI00129AD81D|nr:TonB-dependent receptor [Foetidibacter luteolus]
MRKALLWCWALLFSLAAYSQTKEITGTVTDSRTGNPLENVTVKTKGGKATALTRIDGTFSITVDQKIKELVFSYVGFEDMEVPVTASSFNIQLLPSDKSLSEVVVVGYGTKVKRDVTGSVAKISAKEITNTPATSFETAIQGRAAGVFVQQQNGKVGQGINIRIRGAASVTAGNEPLYVIDGIPVITANLSSNGAQTNPLADINMNDIESIEILKDASAAAIYGSRGSNGVVLISTKKGKSGTSKVDVSYFTGFQKPTRKMKFMDAQQYVDYFMKAAIGGGKQDYIYYPDDYANEQEAIDASIAFVESRLTRYSAGNEDWKTAKVNTNWQDLAFQDAPISQYDVNFSGGNDKTKFFASGQYLDQDGIMVRNNYKRYSGRLNVDHQMNNWLNIGMNMNLARSNNFRISNDNAFSTPLQIVALSPITPEIDPRTGLPSGQLDPNTGAPNTNYPVYYNPLLSVNNASYETRVNRTIGNFYGNVKLSKHLNFRSEFGADLLSQNEEAYYGTVTARNTGVPNGSGFFTSDEILNVTTNNFFNYSNTFKEIHALDVSGGMSYQKQTRTSSLAEGETFPSDAYKKLQSAASKTDATTESTEFTFLSYFLRANYKLNDRYIIAVSGRYDGSSRFGTNNRYGFFPAASAAWIMTEESFMQNIHWLNFLKVKASYGITGNAEIGNFDWRGLYAGDAAYGGQAGQRPIQIKNPDLKWETTAGMDFGLEGSIFNNRLGFEIAYYERRTRDLLLDVEIPSTSGFTTQLKNIGNLTNKGIEVTLNSTNVSNKSFRWTTSLNFAANRNKITNLGGQVLGADQNKAKEGEALGIFMAREFAGADPANGDALYYKNTLKTDGTRDRTTTNDYNEAQDVVIGNPNPDFIYGFTNTFVYKNFDLDVLLQGVQGNENYLGGGQYMSASGSNGFDNQTLDQLGAWEKPGDITMIPEARLFYGNGVNPSSRYIANGSYLRVKAVTLGFNLPAKIAKKMKLERLRLYARAQNLFTITNYVGWDPEVNSDYQVSNINQGVDFYSAPQIKSIVFGINIGL